MNNPYQSPETVIDGTEFCPGWYTLFYSIYQPLWWLGVGLAMAGIFNWVPAWVSYLGLAIWACTAAAVKYLPRLAGLTTKGWVFLTPEQMEEDDEVGHATINELTSGYTLCYKENVVHLYGENILACSVESKTPDPTETEVRLILGNVDNALLELANYSKTFQTIFESRKVHIIVVPKSEGAPEEICRSIDGRLIWNKNYSPAE